MHLLSIEGKRLYIKINEDKEKYSSVGFKMV